MPPGEYARLRTEGRAYVRTHYSYSAIVKRHYFPAIDAYRKGIVILM